jgi:APA family basic amino acid/polyamine antiporter
MRISDPDIHRPFKTPLVPIVPILGIGVCLMMIISLPGDTILSAVVWMVIGLLVYFAYSRGKSKLHPANLNPGIEAAKTQL